MNACAPWRKPLAATLLAVLTCAAPRVSAQVGGRLLATSGGTQIEGSAGGGLVPWALIAGYGTRDEVGGSLHETYFQSPDFGVNSAGAALGWRDRVELSYAHDVLFAGRAGERLGLGRGYQFNLDVAGAKIRLFGNAVYDQAWWLPQMAAGVQVKWAGSHDLLHALGARTESSADIYLAATKLFLAQSLLLNVTLRATRANQFGFLGFGSDRQSGYRAEPEASATLLLSRHFAVGAEWRGKPDNLAFAREDAAWDLFGAWFINKHLALTLAAVSLGRVPRQGDQTGGYLSLQLGF